MAEKDRAINPLGFQVTDYRIDADAADPAGAPAADSAQPQAAAQTATTVLVAPTAPVQLQGGR